MATTINRATLAREVNGVIEYIYPKTDATLVEYDSTQSVKQKIDALAMNIENNDDASKVNKPVDENGNAYDGMSGQVLETNGDGTTSWVSRARVYVGSGDMPEGYDIQIDPEATAIEIDKTLSVEGAVAEAKSTGDAINRLTEAVNNASGGENKIDKPLSGGIAYNGAPGQVLETNGDGTTSWVTRARVYVGSGTMPEGYDVQIDPHAASIEVDPTLNIEGAVAEAKATGDAIKSTKEKITSDIESHNTDIASHTDIRTMITSPKDYIIFRDVATGEEYKVYVKNGEVVCDPTVIKCTGITITTMPTKTSYSVGNVFDPTGMVVTASYNDDSTKVIRDYVYPTTGLTAGTTSVTITYIEGGITVTATVNITVVVKCIDITLTSQPVKTSYNEGDVFDPTGMIVIANYDDGTTKVITNYTYPTTPLTADLSIITISYIEDGKTFTTNVPISVEAQFNPATHLQDFTYIDNGDGTYTITGWKGTLNGVASTEVVVPNSKYIIVNPSI